MPSQDLNREWGADADAVLPWTTTTCVPVRFGKVEIVRYDAGPARRIDLVPRDSVLEMLLSPTPVERIGIFRKVGKGHPMGNPAFVPAGHALAVEWPATGPVRAIRCHYQMDQSDRRFTDAELIAGLAVNSPALVETVHSLAKELDSPGFQSSLLAESLAAQGAIELGRYLRRNGQPGAGRLTTVQMALIDQRIEAGTGMPAADELARLCQMSRRHFFRLFRQTTGMTPASYMIARQIQRAKRLLGEEGAVTKRIAHVCGFRTAPAFSAAFKRETGTTPREFRMKRGR